MPPLRAKTGDRFWTMLTDLSSAGDILAASPYNAGQIHIDKTDFTNKLDADPPPTYLRSKTPLGGTQWQVAAYIEVTNIINGTIHATIVPEEQRPDACPVEFPGHDAPGIDTPESEPSVADFFQTDREEAVEWTGTDQTYENRAQKRSDAFNEGNVRGGKNDLLGGHL